MQSMSDKVNWQNAWDEYVRGNVVSITAAQLIRSFLLNTMTSSGKADDDAQSDADAAEDESELPPLKLPCQRFRELLRPADAGEGHGTKIQKAARQGGRGLEYQHSHRVGEQLWKTEPVDAGASDRADPGNMFENSYQDHLAALTETKKDRDAHDAPFDHERDAAASFNPPGGSERNLDNTMMSIMESSKKPNQKQEEFLRHFVGRLKFEWLEKQQGNVNDSSELSGSRSSSTKEPLLDLVHGFPGTGKSAVIGWMRQLMEDGLGWEHGVQFVCLAFQNSMAAQINGHTVHHWSGIPVQSDSGSSTGDKHKQSIKCKALRMIIIDEVPGGTGRAGVGGGRRDGRALQSHQVLYRHS